MIKRFKDIADKLGVELEDLLQVSNQEVEDISTLETNGQKIVIFDDYICSEGDQSAIMKYFITGRHKQISVIHLSQSYYKVPKPCRLNCNYYIVYDFPSANERSLISNELQIEKDKFVRATKEPFTFLYVNRPEKKIYKCFNQKI